jgi:hypothetical protein
VAVLLVAGPCAYPQALTAPQPEGFPQNEFTPGAAAKLGLGLLVGTSHSGRARVGSGRAGLARRAEWLAAGWVARASTEYAVASYRGVDTAYRPCACKGFPRRAAHALHAGFLEYRGAIRLFRPWRTLAASRPERSPPCPFCQSGYGLSDAAKRTVTAFGVDEGFNVLREFRREIVHTLVSSLKALSAATHP